MGKKLGPCFHCGIDVTPLWRNGPEDKPVLCNACGSRYKKRGSLGLEDYLPKNFQPQYFGKYKDLKVDKSAHLWSTKIPTRKRSEVVYKEITPLERFHIRLLQMSKNYRNPTESPSEEVLLLNNVNNFIPCNEIGIGCVILK
ncbi:hypothetical protein PHAVU_002G250800 [Phaseolus vulgaris]|uniref:GATA-type domain-containing protein n=1 Tax=Phaseolus vulgaris TaxID=3885 RepID=V7CN03_PHAVU|nr:hypothetical protein PHAVU_002G250800g [Phaseolus vulgaris]ESW31592.1 hypothetical protein PHAVU_002G250800g [Phaseolus vulgaris]